jgi:hypothetical protein
MQGKEAYAGFGAGYDNEREVRAESGHGQLLVQFNANGFR